MPYPVWWKVRVKEVMDYVHTHGGQWDRWYCGIAADPVDRLFCDHQVKEVGGAWIYTDLVTDRLARDAESVLHSLGCKGSHGGGGEETKFLYCYRITLATNEEA
jgi:hypothetical protein